MTAEQYMKSQLDGTFMKWLGFNSEGGHNFPFKKIKVKADFEPIYYRPPAPETGPPKPKRERKPYIVNGVRGHRGRRQFDENERRQIKIWMNLGISQAEIVANLRCGRDVFGRYLKEARHDLSGV
jgi:hypothetical protein